MNLIRNLFITILISLSPIFAQSDSIAIDIGRDGLFVFVSSQALSENTPDENGTVKARVLRSESGSGNFEEIGITQMAENIDEFYSAAGVENTDTISNKDSIWAFLQQNPVIQEYGFDAMNPGFLVAMGAAYYDKEVEPNLEYQYKVEYLDAQENIVKEAISEIKSPSNSPTISQPKFDDLIKTDSTALITWKAELIQDEESFFTDLFYQVNGKEGYKVVENISVKRTSEDGYVYQTLMSPLKKGNYYRVYIKPKNFLNKYGPSSDTTGFFFVDYNDLELMSGASAKDSSFGIYLSWDKLPPEPYYNGVEIKKSNNLTERYRVLDTVSISVDDYYDKDVEDKQTYFYRFTPVLSEDVELPFQANASATFSLDEKNLLAPFGLSAKLDGETVQLNWSNENQPFAYNVYRSRSFSGKGEVIAPTLAESNFVDSINTLTDGKDYVYYVTAINEDNIESTSSNKVSIKLESEAYPPEIHELTGYAEANRIRLTWEDARADYGNLAGYNIYRKSADEKSYKKINKEVIPQNYFDDNKLQKGKRYSYNVRSVNYDGIESSSSNSVNFLVEAPDIPVPQNIRTRSTQNGIVVSWSKVIDDRVIAYIVYREDEASGERVEIVAVKSYETSFTDKKVELGKLYHYSIKTETTNSESEYSPIKSERFSQ